MFDSFVTWASANPYLSLWFQGLGTVLAALIALIAALIIYAGLQARAKAMRDIAGADRLEATRGLAVALLAELTDYEQRLEHIQIELLSSSVSAATALPSLSIEGSIYAANTASLGRLPSKIVFDVVRTYKLIDDINRHLMFIPMPLSSLAEWEIKKLRDQITLPIHEVTSVVRQLAAISGIKLMPPQVAKPQMEETPEAVSNGQ